MFILGVYDIFSRPEERFSGIVPNFSPSFPSPPQKKAFRALFFPFFLCYDVGQKDEFIPIF